MAVSDSAYERSIEDAAWLAFAPPGDADSLRREVSLLAAYEDAIRHIEDECGRYSDEALDEAAYEDWRQYADPIDGDLL